MPKSRLIIIGAVGLALLVATLIFLGIFPGLRKDGGTKDRVTLTVWGVFDSQAVISAALTPLENQYDISYREMNPQTYESELINALAAGTGPDVFMLHSSWYPKHFDKLTPAGTEQFPLAAFRSLFPTVAEQDFAPDGVIFASPLYIDTLALFLNRDLMDSAGVALPPNTWAEFQALVPKLRLLDSSGRLVRAAAAIGGSNKNVNRASDILSALMLQSGAQMVSQDFSRAAFAASGLPSLAFYTGFANPADPFYTWSEGFKNSVDGFADGSVAMLINYGYQIPLLRAKNPFLQFTVAPLPRPETAATDVNYASYWGLAVSNRSRNPQAAWSFIISLTTDPAAARAYAASANRLPALRSLIAEKLNDPNLAVFAKQALSARSWPQIDSAKIEEIFSKMIEDVITGRRTAGAAIQEAESAVTAIMEAKKRQL